LTQKNLDAARAALRSGKESATVHEPPGCAGVPGSPLVPRAAAPAPSATPAEAAAQPDDGLTRVMKLVPGEASVTYTAALAISTAISQNPSQDPTVKFLPPIAFLLSAVLVPLIIRRDGARNHPPVKPMFLQYVIQLVAFGTWAFAIGNPLAGFDVAIPKWIPALLTIFVPIFGAQLLRDPAPTDTPAAGTVT
jgi:hypothetical protein